MQGVAVVTEDKAREITLRRTAARRGLRLVRSRRRDPLAVDFGLYWILSANDHRSYTELDVERGMTLEQVTQQLRPDDKH